MFSTSDERLLKGETVARDFYPFVEEENADSEPQAPGTLEVTHPARIAVYDDASAAPRVVVIEPGEVRSYLEEITATVSRLAKEQGGQIPFMVIREIVENLIHAYFQAPTISILDGGNTIRFSDRGPGIKEKARALEYGTSSATEEMKRYIRGVGSGLPYVQQYMSDKGGSLEVEDNIDGGTVVTISTHPTDEARVISGAERRPEPASQPQTFQQPQQPLQQPQPGYPPPYTGWGMPQMPQVPQVPQAPQAPQAPQVPQMPQTSQTPQPMWPAAQTPQISLDERSRMAVSYLAEHESGGPTDLVRSIGSSGSTWSRVLSNLAMQGIVVKDGQKYRLTAIGRTFV